MHIIIISSEQLFRDGLVSLLEGHANVTAGTNIRECVRAARLEKEALVVVDLRFVTDRDIDYLVGAQEFGAFRVLFIADVERAVPEGIEPELSRNASGAELLRQIVGKSTQVPQRVASPHMDAGRKAIPNAPKPRGRPRTLTNSLPLSARQYQAALLASEGRSNSQIAEIMNIREQTVKNVIGIVLKKLDCQNRSQLAMRLMTASPSWEVLNRGNDH